ncbi:hypothetical protein [Anaeromassilibacillus senegalensis]|uniref:hypothetical protein n=1 Tax=Anaeromassilibacillus senegalensis TaxID=1673717 RepID=UPI0012B5B58B|nr:hypothetical protein [Anaeromassilibacillus senegalensis]
MYDYDFVQRLNDIMSDDLNQTCRFELCENVGAENSILIHVEPSAFRSSTTKNILYARIKSNGNFKYVSFPSKFKNLFENEGVKVTQIKSQLDFCRINLDELSEKLTMLYPILKKIFTASFCFSDFGCCSKCVDCSDQMKCIHPDLIYATACQYRKNLENGRVFYGHNRNID